MVELATPDTLASQPHSEMMPYNEHAGAPNNRIVHKDNMLLFDFGAENFCFTSDPVHYL